MRVWERIIIKSEKVKWTEFDWLERADVYLIEIIDDETAIIQWFKKVRWDYWAHEISNRTSIPLNILEK